MNYLTKYGRFIPKAQQNDIQCKLCYETVVFFQNNAFGYTVAAILIHVEMGSKVHESHQSSS